MNKIVKTRMIWVNKSVAVILSLMMIILTLISSGNFIYAADNGELVFKSVTHSKAVKSVIDGNNVTLTLPFEYDSEILDISTISYTLDNAYKLADIVFPSGSEAELDGASVIMDVIYTYTSGDDRTTQFTTRYYINVKSGESPTFSGTISMKTTKQKNIVFDYSDFIDFYKRNDGEDMGFISIGAVKSTVGILEYNGVEYKPNTFISVSDIAAGKLIFQPFNTGTVSYTVTAYADDENETDCGDAVLNIKVEYPVASAIKYSANENTIAHMISDDFADVCKDTTGETLNYVKFTLPSSSKGTLYMDYGYRSESKVSESVKYYENDLDDISFLPYSNYYGTVVISYVGCNDDGEYYSGEIEIKIIEVDIDADDIIYKTGSYTPIDFDSDDFEDECEEVTGERLDYIKFSIPSSVYGVMYYNYTSSTRYGSKVSSSTKYYDSDLDDITFVPKSSYAGTVVISYTGYNDEGESFTGMVKITVVKEVPAADTIKISTKEDVAIRLDDEDFNDASEDSTGEELNYVKFTLPSAKYGKLYYNYTTSNKYDSEVTSGKKYYYDDSPSLSKVIFVPYKNYYGTVTIKYSGYNTDGDAFTGSIKIEVISMPEIEGSLYFKDVTKDYSWAASQIDYLYEQEIVNGTGNNNYSPAQNMTRGDFMLMLYRALNLRATVSGNFSDIPKDSYYYKAIAVAKALGIAKGYDGIFMPNAGITREDAMVLVDRALTVEGKRLPTGKDSNLYGFKDRKTISDYAYTSVATLVKAGIIQGNNSYLNPKSLISRAEMAVILYKSLEYNY